MAYNLTFWQVINADTAHELKSIRLRSVNEVFPLSLEHHKPTGCDAIILERTDNHKYDKVIWANNKAKHCSAI